MQSVTDTQPLQQQIQLNMNPKKLEFLTGIRGLLSIGVMQFHFYDYAGIFRFFAFPGQIAVGGFFVLSSFLLTSKLITLFQNVSFIEFKKIQLILIQYYIRRMLRIIPLYILILILNCLLGQGNNMKEISWAKLPRFIALEQLNDSWLWTIRPEFSWYMLMPVIAFVSSKLIKYWAILSISLFIGSLWVFKTGVMHEFTIYENVYFTAGSILAILYLKMQNIMFFPEMNLDTKRLLQKLYAVIVGLAGYFYFIFWADYHNYISGPANKLICYKVYIFAYFWVVWWLPLIITNEQTIVHRIFQKNSYMFWSGEVSFGIYMIHIIVHNFIQHTLNFRPYFIEISYILKVVITLILSYLSYRFFEKPIMDHGEKVNKKIQSQIIIFEEL